MLYFFVAPLYLATKGGTKEMVNSALVVNFTGKKILDETRLTEACIGQRANKRHGVAATGRSTAFSEYHPLCFQRG